MNPNLARLLSLLFATISLSAAVYGQDNQTVLQPGTSLERTIGPKDSQTLTINLSDEQYLQFVVNQHYSVSIG